MTLRLWLAAVALMALPCLALAQGPPRVPAPDTHAPTGLTFPPMIANAKKVASTDYGKSGGRPDLGYSWNYGTPGLLSATVYVYNFGVPAISSAAGNPVVRAQFEQAYSDIQQMAKYNRYQDLKIVKGPEDCPVGAMVFRCITLSATTMTDKKRVFTALMLGGYRGYFLKLRLDWLENSATSEAVVGRFVQTLVGAIVR